MSVELDKAIEAVRRSRNAMDASSFNGRNRTEELQREVDRLRQAEAAMAEPDICGRLNARRVAPDIGMCLGEPVKVGECPGDLVNPDGPEAAAHIARLTTDLECALDEYESHNGRRTSGPHWSVRARATLETLRNTEHP